MKIGIGMVFGDNTMFKRLEQRLKKTPKQIIKINKTELVFAVVLFAVSLIMGRLSLGENVDFDSFMSFGGDELFFASVINSIKENGLVGMWFNNRMGAPIGSALVDFSSVGPGMGIVIWLLSFVCNSTPRLLYTYLILTFAFDSISMYILMRELKVNKSVSFVIACLFSFSPFHYLRYLDHINMVNYMYVPIMIVLSLYITNFIEMKKEVAIILAFVLGLGFGYYYAFALILLMIAYMFVFIKNRDFRAVLNKSYIYFVLLITIVISNLPKMIYGLLRGNNTEVGVRSFCEQEYFGLKIINLILPVKYSKIANISTITEKYVNSGAPLVTENSLASLGLISTIGLFLLCLGFVISFVDKGRCTEKEWELVDFLSLTTIVLIMTASIGGFGEVFNWMVTAQIRSWNRVSIIIMAISLMIIGMLLNKAIEKNKLLTYICLVLLMVIGCLDQTRIRQENWVELSDTNDMYKDFFADVESRLDTNSMVYQLPYMSFPEAWPQNNLGSYDHLKGYIFTNTIRWSFGAIKGRDDYIKDLYIDDGISKNFVERVREAGFDAIYIDTAGYDDSGRDIIDFYVSTGLDFIKTNDNELYVFFLK